MTITDQYTRTHLVFKEYAARLKLVPFDVRVLAVIFERDQRSGVATYDELYAALGHQSGAQVRRAVLALRCAGLVRIERAGGGSGSGRGIGSQARLTEPGARLARMIVVDCQERGAIAA